MKNRRIIAAVAAVALCAVIVLIAVRGRNSGTQDETQSELPPSPSTEEMALADWDGTWNALVSYLENEELAAVKTSLKRTEGNNLEKKLQTDLISFNFRGTSLTAYSLPQLASGAPAGDVMFELTYTFAGTADDTDGKTWYQFECDTDSLYKYLILLPVEENVIRTFRFKYGTEGFESLLAIKDWMPMMVESSTTTQQLQEAFA